MRWLYHIALADVALDYPLTPRARGADDFLPRPFRAPELGARIFGLIRRAKLARLGSVAPTSANGPRSSGRGGLGP